MYTYGICKFNQIDFSFISLPLNIANMKGCLNLLITFLVSVALTFTYGQDNKQAKTGKICESFLPIFFIKLVFYSETRFIDLPNAKRQNLIKLMQSNFSTWGDSRDQLCWSWGKVDPKNCLEKAFTNEAINNQANFQNVVKNDLFKYFDKELLLKVLCLVI